MGNLPLDRLRALRPLNICGVDFCGPFNTTCRIRGKPPYKSYVFVCFAPKAVHLQLLFDLMHFCWHFNGSWVDAGFLRMCGATTRLTSSEQIATWESSGPVWRSRGRHRNILIKKRMRVFVHTAQSSSLRRTLRGRLEVCKAPVPSDGRRMWKPSFVICLHNKGSKMEVNNQLSATPKLFEKVITLHLQLLCRSV